MPELQPFEWDFEGERVRSVGTSDNPRFVAADVCRVLGIANTSDTVALLDDDERGIDSIYTPGGNQDMLTVTESGLYQLVFQSRKPNAKEFRRWVRKEVLPSIRRTGGYSINQSPQTPVMPILNERRERLEIIELGIDLLARLGGVDQKTEIEVKDLVKDILLADKLQKPALPEGNERLMIPISDRLVQLGYGHRPKGDLIAIGRIAANLYRARYGNNAKPVKREQFVDGATRKVNCYAEEDLDILDAAIKKKLGEP